MTQNPYANIGGYGGGGFGLDQRPQRTSALAVSSLIFSLLCLSAPIGVILGAAGILVILASGGRLKGIGLAVAGTVIGLMVTFAWLLVVLLIVLPAAQLANREFLAPVSTVLNALEAKNPKGARTYFPAEIDKAITDERLAAFREEYHADLGAFRGTPESVGGLVSAYIEFWSQIQAYNGSGAGMPIPAQFEKGRTLVLLDFDYGASGPTPTLEIKNIGVWIPATNKEVWLLDAPAPTPPVRHRRISTPPRAPPAPAPAPDAPPTTSPPPSGG